MRCKLHILRFVFDANFMTNSIQSIDSVYCLHKCIFITPNKPSEVIDLVSFISRGFYDAHGKYTKQNTNAASKW